MRQVPFALAALVLFPFGSSPLPASVAPAPTLHRALDEEESEDEDAKGLEFTLENLFPEKGLFGPSARSLGFSDNGRYATWLYRPYAERRHGNDLHVHDLETGTTHRITSPVKMAPFQANARKVAEDRHSKAEARKKKSEEKGEGDGESTDATDSSDSSDSGASDGGEDADTSDASKNDETEKKWSDEVGEEDADDEDAPRHSGVSEYTWHPTANECLFTSESDVYRLSFGEDGAPAIERLTRTNTRESAVQYLPDGSGYTWGTGSSIARIVFGDHRVEHLQPDLPSGQSISGYSLSPDGKRLALMASTGSFFSGSSRTVNIATYRDRFMKVREVSRMVSDDPMPNVETHYYLYDLPDSMVENGRLLRIYQHKATGPRDILPVPDWAPDSSRVTFARFSQEDATVEVFEAVVPVPDAKLDEVKSEEPERDSDEDEATRQFRRQFGLGNNSRAKDTLYDSPAKVVYRFLHDGGPNTPSMIEPQYLADSRSILLVTEQSGFRHLHVLDPVYQSLRQLTHGHYEVYRLDLPPDRSKIYCQATKEASRCLDVYSVDPASGEMTRLTTEVGQYSSAAVSPDGRYVLAQFSCYGRLSELTLTDAAEEKLTTITDSHPEKAKHFTQRKPEFFEYENRHGHTIHGMLFKPEDWKEDDRRPLLIYVYGGPLGTRKQVVDGSYGSDGYFFARYMAETHGFVTCTIDPRGMSGYGAAFEKANFEQVGKPQVEDLADGVKWLIEHAGVDESKVAIHGWSFGGFQTQMCLYTEPDVFQVGIAGAGPTEWENYNKWYSTGTIGETRDGKPDLQKYSLLPLAKNLKGKLLLVHGMEDSNVLYQDTVRVYSELLEAGKETLVELFVDPTGGHGLGGLVKRLNRYRKYEEFLLRTLDIETEALTSAESGT